MKFESFLNCRNLDSRTIENYKRAARKWNDFVQDKKPTKFLFLKFVKELQKKYKPKSIKCIINGVFAFFKFKKYKWRNELYGIRLPSEQPLSKTIINRDFLLSKLKLLNLNKLSDKKLYLTIYIFLNTGVRVCEIIQMKWNDIHGNKILIKGKGHKYRTVFIPEEFIKRFKNKDKYILTSTTKKNKPISIRTISESIRRFSRKIGIKFSCHDLRRSFCTHLIKSGCNIKVIQTIMGHSTIAVTSRYMFLTEEELFEEWKKYT